MGQLVQVILRSWKYIAIGVRPDVQENVFNSVGQFIAQGGSLSLDTTCTKFSMTRKIQETLAGSVQDRGAIPRQSKIVFFS